MVDTPFRVTLNATEYPATSFAKVEQGQKLTREWNRGFRGGMGQSLDRGGDHSLFPIFLDVSAPPFVRIQPGVTRITGLTGLDTSLPIYPIPAKEPGGTLIIYLLNGANRYKINRTANTLTEVVNTASVIYGRPAFFEGSWRLSRGQTVDSGTLTIGNGAGTDSVAALAGVKADHFAAVQDGATAKLARASLNNISLSSDFVTFGGAFEAGDSSLRTTDLLEWQGELLVVRADGPRRFSVAGDSYPVQRYVGANLSSGTYEGANSFTHGAYAYWVGSSGIKRIAGDMITDVGFETYPDYYADASDQIDDTVAWNSIVCYGRWAYGGRGQRVYQGYIEDDGTITWLSAICAGAFVQKVAIDDTPALWVSNLAIATDVLRITLMPDGSTRNVLGSTRGGGTTGTAQMTLPKIDWGMPDRLKQIRRVWAVLEGMSSCTYQARIERDGAAAQNVGAGITASGFTESTLTPGTTDTAREVRPSFTMTTTGTSDSRLRAFGIEAHTFDVYEAVIPLTPESVRGFSGGIKGLLKKLRDLQNAQLIAIKEPEVNATRDGYVMAVSEKALGSEGGTGAGYEVRVRLEIAAAPA